MSGYTSDLLCHFVGRSKSNDEERYELMKTIINENKLIANINNPDKPEISSQINDSCNEIGEVFDKIDCVCFCDIPDEHLDIHINKYSKFGFGFNKKFIAKQGARPVIYIPQNYDIIEPSHTSTPKDADGYFNYIRNLTVTFNTLVSLINQNCPFETVFKTIEEQIPIVSEFKKTLDTGILSNFSAGKSHQMIFSETSFILTSLAYIKKFDVTLEENDPNNYYMEREWRSLKNIEFTLNDVDKIYLPDEIYKERFTNDFPEYSGNIYVFNQSSTI